MSRTAGGETRICLGCWDQMHVPIPIRGALSLPFRMVGITRSKMNPNICTICERAFRRVKKQRHVSLTASILFADMRGFTRLSERLDPLALSDVVAAFQDQCAEAVWAHDGIVNKQMGDGLMAIFNFPIRIDRHAEAALAAGRDIQNRCRAPLAAVAKGLADAAGLGVGVGIHTGQVEIGEFTTNRSDFTAIGGTVNLAARLEAQAAAGEILISPESAIQSPGGSAALPTRLLSLKGIEHPVEARVMTVDG